MDTRPEYGLDGYGFGASHSQNARVEESDVTTSREREEPDASGSERPVITITKEDLLSVPDWALRPSPRRIRVTPTEKPRLSGTAITSLIFALVGLPMMGILIGPFAIMFGGRAIREINRTTHLTGRSLAVTGIALGVFETILWFVLLAVFLISGST